MYRDIPTPEAWYDASTLIGLPDNGEVFIWPDKNGTYDSTGNGSTKPRYRDLFINGNPAIEFSGSNSFSSPLSASQNVYTIFMVAAPSSLSGNRNVIGATTGGGREFRYNNATRQNVVRSILAGAATPTEFNAVANQFEIATAEWDAATQKIYVNGVEAISSAYAPAISPGLTTMLGAGTAAFTGKIAEIIFYHEVLSPEDRATVHSYLQDKYAINVADYVAPPDVDPPETDPPETDPPETDPPEPVSENVLPLKTGRKPGYKMHQEDDSNKISWSSIHSDSDAAITNPPNVEEPWTLGSSAFYQLNSADPGNYTFSLESVQFATTKSVLTPNLIGTTPVDFYTSTFVEDIDDFSRTLANTFEGLKVNDMRKAGFGIVADVKRHYGGDGSSTSMRRIRVSDFRLSVPKEAKFTSADILGLTGRYARGIGGGVVQFEAYLQGLLIDVKYDYEGTVGGTDSDQGYARISNMPEQPISQKKSYQYNVYRDGMFLNEYKNVTSEPKIKNSVNNLPGEMNVTISRDLEGGVDEFDNIAITGYDTEEDDDNILLTTTQEPLLATIQVTGAIGDGTDIAKNNYIDLKEYYGGFESLLTSDGEELLTSDLEPLFVENGYPLGHSLFKGFISKYRYGYNDKGAFTGVRVLSHVDEWNNIVLETEDTARLSVPRRLYDGGSIQNNRFYRNERATVKVGQTFNPTSSFDLAGISVPLQRGGFTEASQSEWPTVLAILRLGAPNGTGAVLATATQKIDSYEDFREYTFSFEGVRLTAGTTYSITLQAPNIELANPSAPPYLGVWYAANSTNPYSGGAMYRNTVDPYVNEAKPSSHKPGAGDTFGVATGFDLAFTLWERGGETTVAMNSMSPSAMLRRIGDYALRRGSQIRYTDTSIAETGTIVSGRFNTNKLTDAVAQVLKYSPSDWYTFYDPAELTVNLLPRPEVVKHWFELGKNIEEVFFEEDIEDLVNEVYFSGGATAGGKNLMKRFVDALSQSEIRRGLAIISDSRVIDEQTAEIMAMSEINRKKEAVIIGEATIIRKEYEEVVQPGELCGFMAFGNHIDFLRLQAVQTELTPDYIILKLGVLLPPVSKRVEDIRRNLEILEMQNNPLSPS